MVARTASSVVMTCRVGDQNDLPADRFHDRVTVVRDGGHVGGEAGVAGEGF